MGEPSDGMVYITVRIPAEQAQALAQLGDGAACRAIAAYLNYAEGSRRRKETAKAEGRTMIPNVKPGHRLVGPKGQRRIVVDPQQQEAIEMIVQLRDAGQTYEQIFRELRRRKVVWLRYGRRPTLWSRERIRRVYEQRKRSEGESPLL